MIKSSAVVMLALSVAACASGPKTPSERISLEEQARVTLSQMEARDPSLRQVLMDVDGYVVFPEIGEGGAIVGGAYGHGVLYERGRPTGVVTLSQASLGLQLGGQTFAELIVLRGIDGVQKIKQGEFDLGADIGVTVLTAGAARAGSLGRHTSVLVMPRGGLMAGISVNGQRLKFQPYSILGNGQG